MLLFAVDSKDEKPFTGGNFSSCTHRPYPEPSQTHPCGTRAQNVDLGRFASTDSLFTLELPVEERVIKPYTHTHKSPEH